MSNNKYMKKSILHRINYIFFILSIIFISNYFRDPIFWIIADFFMMLIIIFKAKISFFSLNTVVSTYPLIAVICEYYFDFSYGLLHVSTIPIHITQISICIFIFNAILGYMVFCTKAIEKEKKILKYIPQKSTRFTCEIFSIISAILIIIAFPYGLFSFEHRQQAALGGSSWMLLALYAVFFSLPYFKKSNVVKIFDVFTLIWYFLHAERVEFIGFLFMIAIVVINQKNIQLQTKDYIKFICLALVLVITFAFVGNLVRGSDLSFNSIIKSSLVQGSMVDMMYVFNTGIDFVEKNGLIYGKTLGVYLDKIMLLKDSSSSYTYFLRNYAYNAGGGYALTDGYLNFGYIGVAVQSLIQLLWINFCLKKVSNYRYFCYCFLISMCFRYTWYGYYYYEKTPIIYIPLFILMQKIFLEFEQKHTLIMEKNL